MSVFQRDKVSVEAPYCSSVTLQGTTKRKRQEEERINAMVTDISAHLNRS